MKKHILWLSLAMFGCFDMEKSAEDESDNDDTQGYYMEGQQQGDCFDGVDNDQDGETDCQDPGCFDKPACDNDTLPPELETVDPEDLVCGGNAPVVTELSCENSGIQIHPDYGELPTFSLSANVTDEDGDLTYYQMFVDIDDNLDGIEAEDHELAPVEGMIGDDECSIFDVTLEIIIFLQGSSPEYGTTYEWYVRISDSMGQTSDPFMVTCTTPDENGDGSPY